MRNAILNATLKVTLIATGAMGIVLGMAGCVENLSLISVAPGLVLPEY